MVISPAHSARFRLAAAALTALLLFTTLRAAWPARDLSSFAPPTTQVGESGRGRSTPADKAQGSAASDVVYAALPDTVCPLSRTPDVQPVSWREIGVFRPGHPQRIDHPPRRGA